MRVLGLLLVITACNPSGLTIEVIISDPNIKKVELMAGDSCHPDCPRGTVPPGLPAMPLDDAFVVVDPQPFVVVEADFTDGVAGFRIESPTDVSLPILVALGYDAQNELRWSWSQHWVAIPDADSVRWQIHLDATTVIGAMAGAQPPNAERHKLWPDPAGHTSCVLLEHWDSAGVPSRELISPKTDSDCDGVPAANECAPWIPNAVAAPPTIETASCVLPAVLPTGADICVIGGPQCTEDPLQMSEACDAVPGPYCAPGSVCMCAGRPDAIACLAQAIMAGSTNSTTPFVKCVIPVNPDGSGCSGSSIDIDVSQMLPIDRTCKAIRLNELELPLGPFEDFLHVGQGKLRLSNFTDQCAIEASWEGGMAPLVNHALVELEVDNGYHLVIPFRVDFKPGCDAAGNAVCQLVMPAMTGESIYNCASAPPSPQLACVGDSSHGCAGPYCNGQCCDFGERCTVNGCSCAGGPACTDGDRCEPGINGTNTCGALCCGVTTLCPL